MKKVLCLVLSLALLLGLTAGCGGQQSPTEAGSRPGGSSILEPFTIQGSETETPATDVPVTEEPSAEAPSAEVPSTEVPSVEAPSTETPATEVPDTEVPATEVPSTEIPTTEVPATDPPATEPPTTQAPEEGTAAAAYLDAVSELPENYRLTIHWEMSRSMGPEMILTTDDITREVRGAGSDRMQVQETLKRCVEGNAFSEEFTYQTFCSGGNALLMSGGLTYGTAQDAESFLAERIPAAMLHLDNYDRIEWLDSDYTSVIFTDATDTEWEWLGINCTGVTDAEGVARLDGTRLIGTDYDAVFSLEGIEYAVHITADLEESTAPLSLPEVRSAGIRRIKDLRAVPLMDMASLGFLTEGFTGNYLAFVQSYAAGSVALQQGWIGIDADEAGPMLYERTDRTVYTRSEESHNTEYRAFGGKATYLVDGEEQELTQTPEESEQKLLDFLYDQWPELTDLENISLTEEEDCWLLEADLSTEGMKWAHANAEQLLFAETGYLEDRGISFSPSEGTLCVSLDKGSGFPIHSMLEMEGNHRYQGQELLLSSQIEWNYLPADPDAVYVITEKWEDKGTPEVPATPLFYKVTAPEGGTMWLLGTIHIGDDRSSFLPQELYDALLSSDALAVEIDVTNMEERLEEDESLLNAYQQSILYLDGTDAFDHLNEEQSEKLEKALKIYGGYMPAYILNYNVSALTSMFEQQMLPLGRMHSYEHGVDNQLVAMAKDHGIPVRDVEDFVEHISLLANFSEELQALMLEETLDGGRYGSNMSAAELFDVWCRGSEEEIQASFEEEEEDEELTEEEKAMLEEYNHGMMVKRNAQMVERAKEYMASGETVFFAVGLAHLMDEDGIVSSLRNAGYTVEQVRYGE